MRGRPRCVVAPVRRYPRLVIPAHLPTGRMRALLAAALTAALVLLAATPLATSQSASQADAVAQLRSGGVYVSPRALGEVAAQARAELARARSALLAERRTVAFAIVPGPVGSPSLQIYARRLHREAELKGPLLVVAPGRPLAVTGTEAPARAAAALARAGIDSIPNPVERLITAAGIVSVPAPEPDGTREAIILLLLAGLGGAWAVAWGTHRSDRARRDAVSERRLHLRLGLDALEAHAAALAHDPDAAPPSRRVAREVLAGHASTLAELHGMRAIGDGDAVAARIRAGFETLAAALPPGMDPPSADDPFAGLCRVDPAHGRAVAAAAVAGAGDDAGVCGACARIAAGTGAPLEPRLIPSGREAMPFPAARGCLRTVPPGPAEPALNA